MKIKIPKVIKVKSFDKNTVHICRLPHIAFFLHLLQAIVDLLPKTMKREGQMIFGAVPSHFEPINKLNN